jgi:hypothetical protein
MATVTVPTITAPTISKRQFISWFSILASLATTGITVLDPSVHLNSDAKGFLASAATLAGGVVAGWYQHSSHQKQIALIEADAKKVLAGVVSSLPPQVPTA